MMIKKYGLALCLGLSACAPTPEVAQETVYVTYQVPKRFEAEGKVGLRYPECPKYEACKVANYQLEFVWEHTPEVDDLKLIDPLGKERVRLQYQGGTLQLSENGGAMQVMSEQELEQHLGVKFPLAEFKALFTVYGEEETWQDWRLKRSQFNQNHYEKLILEQGDYRILLVINDWREK